MPFLPEIDFIPAALESKANLVLCLDQYDMAPMVLC
jgi:hypothetical protein